MPPAPGAGGRSWKVHAPVREKPGPVAAEPPTKARAPEGDGDRRSCGPCALVDCTRAAWGAWWGLSLSLSGLCTPHSCTDTCTHVHAQADARRCTRAQAHTHTNTCTRTRAGAHMHTHACMCRHPNTPHEPTCTRIYTCMHTLVDKHVQHAQAHMYARACTCIDT